MKNFKIAENLKRLRKSRGWSFEKLASISNLASITIINLEQKRNLNPNIYTLIKLADIFNVSIDELINYKWIIYFYD